MKTATTEYALLGMLSMQPMSGYQLRQFAEGSIGHFWSESFGQIYPALARLARAGEIRELPSKRQATGSEGREQRMYEVTAKGRKQLAEWLPMAARRQVLRDELLLKLFFGAEAPIAVSRQHLQQQADNAQARLSAYGEIEPRLQRLRRAPPPDGPRVMWWEMTLRRGILDCRAELQWCQESLRTLDGLEKRTSGAGKGTKQQRGRKNATSAAGKKAKR
jgi:PadR family transcriptional regulator, regulatory protein AphA